MKINKKTFLIIIVVLSAQIYSQQSHLSETIVMDFYTERVSLVKTRILKEVLISKLFYNTKLIVKSEEEIDNLFYLNNITINQCKNIKDARFITSKCGINNIIYGSLTIGNSGLEIEITLFMKNENKVVFSDFISITSNAELIEWIDKVTIEIGELIDKKIQEQFKNAANNSISLKEEGYSGDNTQLQNEPWANTEGDYKEYVISDSVQNLPAKTNNHQQPEPAEIKKNKKKYYDHFHIGIDGGFSFAFSSSSSSGNQSALATTYGIHAMPVFFKMIGIRTHLNFFNQQYSSDNYKFNLIEYRYSGVLAIYKFQFFAGAGLAKSYFVSYSITDSGYIIKRTRNDIQKASDLKISYYDRKYLLIEAGYIIKISNHLRIPLSYEQYKDLAFLNLPDAKTEILRAGLSFSF